AGLVDDLIAPQLALEELAPYPAAELLDLPQDRGSGGGERDGRQALPAHAAQEAERLRSHVEAARALRSPFPAIAGGGAVEAQQCISARRQSRPPTPRKRLAAARTGLGGGEDAGEAQNPGLKISRREVAVHPFQERLQSRVEEPVEE